MRYWMQTDDGTWVTITYSEMVIITNLYPNAVVIPDPNNYCEQHRTAMIYG